jgi:hemolysin activation/secretion protein
VQASESLIWRHEGRLASRLAAAAVSRRRRGGAMIAGLLLTCSMTAAPSAVMAAVAADTSAAGRFDILEFAVEGTSVLTPGEIESAVYPFLGPDKSTADIEEARAALERIYHDRGYESVVVGIPQARSADGVVRLQVTEYRVGRLRVRGARYYAPSDIKEQIPALAEGSVPNFSEAQRQLDDLNRRDPVNRQITPSVRAGVAPGTVDFDLVVEDELPLHASLEINNRQSPDTKRLRLNTTLRYDNLWQLGHSISFGNQVAPERPDDSLVYSGSYLAPVPGVPSLSLMLFGFKSDSDVATVGGSTVVGKGQQIGGRAIVLLPPRQRYNHRLSAGVDYKDFEETTNVVADQIDSPITYYPFSISYNGEHSGEDSTTDGGAELVFSFRGLGSDTNEFDQRRFGASSQFIILRGFGSNTYTLPADAQVFTRFHGQVGNGPLVNNEQMSIGGLDTVRGFLESSALGDYGLNGTVEVRSPSFAKHLAAAVNEWRVHVFFDGGRVGLFDALPDQENRFDLASLGWGTRLQLLNYLYGSFDMGFAVLNQGVPDDDEARFQFRVWGEI